MQPEADPQPPVHDQAFTCTAAPTVLIETAPSHASNDAPSKVVSEGAPAVTVIRGFSPSKASSLYNSVSLDRRASPPDAVPERRASPAHQPVHPKKQPARLALGSTSGNESPPRRLGTHQPVPPLKKMFTVCGSSGQDDSPWLKSTMHSSRPMAQKNQPSFNSSFCN